MKHFEHRVAVSVPGMFFGWPVTNGAWTWDGGKEILMGFSSGKFVEQKGHNVAGTAEPAVGVESLLARSSDGGKTWKVENPENYVWDVAKPIPAPGGIAFDQPGFALRAVGIGYHGSDEPQGSFFFSQNRGRAWQGPFRFTGLMEDVQLKNMVCTTRTGYMVTGKDSCPIASAAPPPSDLDLVLDAPIDKWDEAVPLGNGTMGVLLWGSSDVVRLSLDRGDLWDERPAPLHVAVKDRFNWKAMQEMIAINNMAEFNKVFDSNYDYDFAPTKLPAGRVEIPLPDTLVPERFRLKLATAEGHVEFEGGAKASCFVDAADIKSPVVLLRFPGVAKGRPVLRAPESVRKLGYPNPIAHQGDNWMAFDQPGAHGFRYVVALAWRQAEGETLFAATVATSREGHDAVAVARQRMEKALADGHAKRLAAHAAWWKTFWEKSAVTVPEPHIARHYYLVRYFYGAASRRGAPPMPLQGVWSADAGTLPPWKGDYHNDLNTQMTYMGYQAAGHFDEGATWLDLLWDLLPTFRRFARGFYDAPGAAVPGVMSLAGQALGGWGQYSLSPTMGAWNAHNFYLHWRYTGDAAFLRERAYPWSAEIGECLIHLLKPDANGVLVLPLSSSPEIYDNTRRAFVTPNSNYDLMSLRMLFLSLQEMAAALGKHEEAKRWRAVSDKLGHWHTRDDGTLKICAKEDLPGSHRHFSNLMGIHPFNLITSEGGESDRRTIEASLREWDKLGTKAWCGYSFSWMAALRARTGDAEQALRHLDLYARAFILRNGFHANGDQTRSGLSGFTYRPFTLEGNFLAMHAVHEMLLQSWSPTPGTPDTGVIRLFPATPWRWHDAAFDKLRGEAGHVISARRENNATTWFRITAGCDGLLRLRDNFGGRAPQWTGKAMIKSGTDFTATAKAGDVFEARLPKPEARPPAPPNAAAPVEIKARS
jgi:alpha-L-fucosidase 2